VAREFRLPDIGEGLTEAEIVRWLVPVGGRVEADEPLVEVETDKAVVEIPSPYAGTVLKHGGSEGDVVEVGTVLVVIGEESETVSAPPDSEPALAESPNTAAVWDDTPKPIVGTLDEEAEVIDSVPEPTSPASGQVKALPVVRKLARDNGIDLAGLVGSGPTGRITREDVQAAIARTVPTVVTASPTQAPLPSAPSTQAASPTPATDRPIAPDPMAPNVGEDETRTMSRLRRTIAANMAKSWAEIPHVTTFEDVDATRLLEVRSALGERYGTKIPIEALVIRAVLPALAAFPEFNATIDGADLVIHGSHDIGIAVDTPDGLLVAVVRDADSKGVLQLAEEIQLLGSGAKDRKLGPSELTGQTFTVSNIGAVGGGHGTPIVPYGTTGILSVGRAKEKAVVYDGDLLIAPVMPLSLSYDHRVVDGGQGRRFMAMLIENLEEPALFLA
jgi:pyruvate dehydrogenase E2 component (dihydrolipoamide acetyltransferase)